MKVITHSLRGASATLFHEAGRSDAVASLLTGHVHVDSLKSYTNLTGEERKVQQSALFSSKLCKNFMSKVDVSGKPSLFTKNDIQSMEFSGIVTGAEDVHSKMPFTA